ncbi:MAG: ABC transporter ATP-binding protein [Chlorobi bacterium]|nr:ABC transporter ATP-binding protein [Chlorobiota bacterium]
MLTLKQLDTGFITTQGQRRILASGLDLSAREGELTAIVGPNGIGKSTLLRTIMRLQPALGGTIDIDGRNTSGFSTRDFARFCSFVPAGKIPVARLTVEEIITLARYPHTGWFGKLSPEDIRIVEEAIYSLNLQDLRLRFIDELSDGEKQRTWIARALAQGTPLVILDEPTAFLDIPNRFEIYRLLRQIAVSQHRLFLFASHDLEFVSDMTDKIWMLLPGEFFEGAPEDIISGGILDKLFRHSGITFHPEKGLMFPQPEPEKYLVITGDSSQCQWIKRALKRAGFGIITEVQQHPFAHIFCSKNEIVLEKNDRKIRFSSVYALILFLKTNH